ncbi:MAG TPA: hypothetical protein VHF06_29285 [Pseudonocardiaceae bacterium]|nr:hypothetical protein [Pseudonocardiaceae bacterium]
MASHTLRSDSTRVNLVTMVVLRVVSAGLLLTMGWIHYYLWAYVGFNTGVVGVLFLINGIVSALLALAVLFMPGRMLGITAALSSLFTLGTLAALLGSMWFGLFGFYESVQTPLVPTTLVIEPIGVIVLAVLAVVAARQDGMWRWLPSKQQ